MEPTRGQSKVKSGDLSIDLEAGFKSRVPTTTQDKQTNMARSGSYEEALSAGARTADTSRVSARSHGTASGLLPETTGVEMRKSRVRAPITKTMTRSVTSKR